MPRKSYTAGDGHLTWTYTPQNVCLSHQEANIAFRLQSESLSSMYTRFSSLKTDLLAGKSSSSPTTLAKSRAGHSLNQISQGTCSATALVCAQRGPLRECRDLWSRSGSNGLEKTGRRSRGIVPGSYQLGLS